VALIDSLSTAIAGAGGGPVFVHSDPFRAARLVKPVRDRNAYLDAHIALLREAASGRSLWIPTFNYDFPRTKVFDTADSESQLGPIPERFRTAVAEWRTPIPMFSVAGIGAKPRQRWGEMTDPFGADSMFAELVEQDGVVLYYGDTFHYNTIVHYAERLVGGPMYRYDKVFEGVVIDNGVEHRGSLNYHVRPFGTGLDYDWPRLQEEAIAAGVVTKHETYPEILVAPAKRLCDLWVREMRHDPCALLDEKSRRWVEPAIEEAGRRFVITDFEAPETLGVSR
jgi:aminoglycoside 3-N-acetyltransferase